MLEVSGRSHVDERAFRLRKFRTPQIPDTVQDISRRGLLIRLTFPPLRYSTFSHARD